MMCERYWREGILLVERGIEDPHRDGCIDCRRAHASRDELVEWLPLVGEGYTGDPDWQSNVWQRIDGSRIGGRRGRKVRPWRWSWPTGGVLAAVCIMLLWIAGGRERTADARPLIEIVPGAKPKRSTDPHVGDRLKVTVGKTSRVWIYRAGDLLLRCGPGDKSEGCTPDAEGMIVETPLSIRGEYVVLVFDRPVAPPVGELKADLAALERAEIAPLRKQQYSVH
jgi:hypothetical protein